MNKIEQLQKIIDESNNIVFFGGAGVSTESGIKDFRSVDGLYNMEYDIPPEIILSHEFFFKHPNEFYKFYKDKMNALKYKPNICHKYLTKLEQKNKLKGIITQNIDGLHQKANSKNVYELHGTIYKNRCVDCNKFYGPEIFDSKELIPKCECGGIIKPEVVLYGEMLDENTINESIKLIENADTLIVAGTSLTVYPAAGFIRYFKGNNLIIINKDSTDYDKRATLVINDSLGNVFKKLL